MSLSLTAHRLTHAGALDALGFNALTLNAHACNFLGMTSREATSAPAAAVGQRWPARLWGVLMVVCTVIALDALDVSMVGVALPSIRADLGVSTSTLQWVVSGYVLGYGGLLLLGG
jgi:hypothetical protein